MERLKCDYTQKLPQMSQGKVSFTFKKKIEPKKLLLQSDDQKQPEREMVTSIEGGQIASKSKKNELVIPLNSGKSIGEVPTMEDYERIPVEDFGTAMLKGMGWKDETKTS